MQAKAASVSDKEEELMVYRKKLEDMEKEVAVKTKELEKRQRTSLGLEVN